MQPRCATFLQSERTMTTTSYLRGRHESRSSGPPWVENHSFGVLALRCARVPVDKATRAVAVVTAPPSGAATGPTHDSNPAMQTAASAEQPCKRGYLSTSSHPAPPPTCCPAGGDDAQYKRTSQAPALPSSPSPAISWTLEAHDIIELAGTEFLGASEKHRKRRQPPSRADARKLVIEFSRLLGLWFHLRTPVHTAVARLAHNL